MAMNFDPYHAWLGIPTGSRPVNHYQMLGLPPFQSEPPIIAEAINEQMAKVKPHLSGEHADVARRILDELAQAKSVLLTAASKRAYDAELRKQMGMQPGSHPAPAASVPAALPVQPVAAAPVMPAVAPMQAVPVQAMPAQAMPMQAMPVQPGAPYAQPMAAPAMAMPVQPAAFPGAPAAVPMAGPAVVGQPGIPAVSLGIGPMGAAPAGGFAPAAGKMSARVRKKKASNTQVAVTLLGLAIIVLLIVVGVAFKDQILAKANPQPPAVQEQARKIPPIGVGAPTGSKPAASRPTSTPPKKRSVSSDIASDLDVAASMPADPSKMDFSSDGKKPMKPSEGMTESPKPKLTETPKPAAPPKPAAAVPVTKAKKPEMDAVNNSLKFCRLALQERHVAKAEEQLDLAGIDAASSDTMAAVQQTRNLIDLFKQFEKGVEEGFKAAPEGGEMTIDGEPASVVENKDGKLVLRIKGMNKNIQLSQIDKAPANIVRALAELWLKKDEPTTKVLVGLFMALDKGSDAATKEAGRKLIAEGGSAGIEVKGILAELDAIDAK
jgi:hypothetical protein